MKSPAAYYLLLIYLFALCKPVVPLFQDIVAHTFFEHQHLSAVHQQSGNHHAKDEVGKLAEKESANNATGSIKIFASVAQHFGASIGFQFPYFIAAGIDHSSFYNSGLLALTLAIQLPPPRVS